MRFYDFVADIKETSERIAARDAYLDLDANAGLTVKTLLRPDVIAFFDSLIVGHGQALPAHKALLFYTIMYAFTVNVRPRPAYDALVEFSGPLLKQLNAINLASERGKVFCATDPIKLPRSLIERLRPVVKIRQTKGLYCRYTKAAPDPSLLKSLCADGFADASLLLYGADVPYLPVNAAEHTRVKFSGPIFTSKRLSFSGVYIGAAL